MNYHFMFNNFNVPRMCRNPYGLMRQNINAPIGYNNFNPLGNNYNSNYLMQYSPNQSYLENCNEHYDQMQKVEICRQKAVDFFNCFFDLCPQYTEIKDMQSTFMNGYLPMQELLFNNINDTIKKNTGIDIQRMSGIDEKYKDLINSINNVNMNHREYAVQVINKECNNCFCLYTLKKFFNR